MNSRARDIGLINFLKSSFKCSNINVEKLKGELRVGSLLATLKISQNRLISICDCILYSQNNYGYFSLITNRDQVTPRNRQPPRFENVVGYDMSPFVLQKRKQNSVNLQIFFYYFLEKKMVFYFLIIYNWTI